MTECHHILTLTELNTIDLESVRDGHLNQEIPPE